MQNPYSMKGDSSMEPFWKRIAVALSTGYILFYYSELVFWAKITPGESPLQLLLTYFLYCLVTYVLLSVVTIFQIRTVKALFLAGAVYGWLIEGVIVQTMYDDFPLQISFTGLAWHSLISVLVGWYYVTRVLLQNKHFTTIRTAVLIGLFYGFWSISWWVEEGVVTPLPEFALYVLLTSVGLIAAHWIYNNLQPFVFNPTRIELFTLGLIFGVWFVFGTLQVQPAAVAVLPPLLGLLYIVLRKNRKIEKKETVIVALQGNVHLITYVLLLFIPLTAILYYAYALAMDFLVPTNVYIYVVTTALGFIMFVYSVVKIYRKEEE